MSDKPWISIVRRESGLVELVCKCGVGHPAYGSVHWLKLHGKEAMDVHSCCGCCHTQEWQLADAREGVEIANKLVKKYYDLSKWYRRRVMLLEDRILDIVGFNNLSNNKPSEPANT